MKWLVEAFKSDKTGSRLFQRVFDSEEDARREYELLESERNTNHAALYRSVPSEGANVDWWNWEFIGGKRHGETWDTHVSNDVD